MQSTTNNRLQFSLKKALFWDLDPTEYRLQSLKKMQVRRFSPMHKVGIDQICTAFDITNIDYLVHTSRHGELNTSDDLIQNIIKGETLSPSKFSQSTHNALPGNLSAMCKRPFPISSISAGKSSISMGMISAISALNSADNEYYRVLFVYLESSPRDLYKDVVDTSNQLACLLFERGNDYSIDTVNDPNHKDEFQSLKDWDRTSKLVLNSVVLDQSI